MKKRTIITTEKREIWIIQEGTETHVWNQASSSDQSSEVKPETDMALTEEKPPTTNEEDQRGEV
jgi:hypothetical protein